MPRSAFFSWILTLAAALALQRVRCAEEVFGSTHGGVEVKVFMPSDSKVLRGIILHVANYKFSTQDRWAELCRARDFAHVALSMNMKENNRPAKMRKALDESLPKLAEASRHPELPHLPIMGTGHSAGGMVLSVLSPAPERMLTNCLDCAWIADPEKLPAEAAAVPCCFTLGAIPDAFNMLPGVEKYFEPARKKGLPWGLALKWGCAHDFGNAACLYIPWMEAVAAARIPGDWDPLTGLAKLRAMKEEDGWLGDRASTDGNCARIASWKDYSGDKSAAAWFPNEATACAWRALVSKDSPVTLEAATPDGSAKLGAINPKSERGLILNPGTELSLGVSVKDGLALKTVAYCEGGRILGEATQTPWKWYWKDIPQGPHVVHAQWTAADGKSGVSNPALIVMRKYEQK